MKIYDDLIFFNKFIAFYKSKFFETFRKDNLFKKILDKDHKFDTLLFNIFL